jgi:hypothetical protein
MENTLSARPKSFRPIRRLLAAVLWLALGASGRPATLVWTNTAGGDWSQPANWQPNQVPGPADSAFIAAPGSYTVNVDVSATVTNLDCFATLVIVSNTLSMTAGGVIETNGMLAMTNATIEGSLVIAAGGTLALDGGDANTLSNLTLLNNGTVDWLSGELQGLPPTVVTNAGLWLADAGNYFVMAAGSGLFNNQGEFISPATSPGALIGGFQFFNSGNVSVLGGLLDLAGPPGLTNVLGGVFTTGPGASVQLVAGSFVDAGAVFTGPGASYLQNATLTLLTNTLPGLGLVSGTVFLGPNFQANGAITNLGLNGATLAGTNVLSGELDVINSALTGELTVLPGGLVVFDGDGQNFLSCLTLINGGEADWRSGELAGSAPLVITNTGLWLAEAGNYFAMNSGAGLFDNAGEFRLNLASGIASLGGFQFLNQGLVSALGGALSMNSPHGFTNAVSGVYYATNGASIQLNGGFFADGGGVFTGPGLSAFENGTLTLAANPIPGLLMAGGSLVLGPGFQQGGAITNLSLAGATLNGTYTVAGELDLTNTTIGGQLTVLSAGTLVFDGAVPNYLSSLVLANAGTVKWQGGDLTVYPPVAITNSGLWLARSDNSLSAEGGVGSFYNSGEFRKDEGPGVTGFYDFMLCNPGVLSCASGTLAPPAGFTNSSGTLNLLGGTVLDTNTTEFSGGTLEGAGSVGPIMLDGGLIAPGTNGSGLMTFLDDFQLGTNAAVTFAINGTVPGVAFPQISVDGGINLAGSLQLPSPVAVQPGTELVLIKNLGGQPVNGTFQGLPEGSVFAAGSQLFRVHYAGGAGNDVSIVGADAQVLLSFDALSLPNGTIQFSGAGANGARYSIEATADFKTWELIGQYSANSAGLFVFTVTNSPEFPRRFFRSAQP